MPIITSQLKTYNKIRLIFGYALSPILLPLLGLAYLGEGAQWLGQRITYHLATRPAEYLTNRIDPKMRKE